VRELHGTDPAASAALWADLLSRDLLSKVIAVQRPVDDPLLHQLADTRRARTTLADCLWLRLVDLPAALRRRRYACPIDLVIEVTDDLLPANAGRWRLAAGGLADQGVPRCERSTADADVTLDVSALGAAYLGGTRLGGLARAGLIVEHRPGAVAALSTAMSWDPAPWTPSNF
jgi:predicted acetyltransferase